MDGITAGLRRGEQELGISWKLIICFLRHLSEENALEALAEAKPHLASIHGVGLDSSDSGNPPSKFTRYSLRPEVLDYAPSHMPGRKGRRNTSGRHSIFSSSSESTMAFAPKMILTSSCALLKKGFR